MRAYWGCDPGAAGCIVVLPESGEPHVCRFTNSTEKQICEFVSEMSFEYENFCVLEQVGAYPGQGVVSVFSFGESYGFIQGVITAFGIPFEKKVPRTWQKAVGITPRVIERDPNDKTKITFEESKVEFKRRVRQKAEQLYPQVKMTNDVADALLIAHFCRITRYQTLIK